MENRYQQKLKHHQHKFNISLQLDVWFSVRSHQFSLNVITSLRFLIYETPHMRGNVIPYLELRYYKRHLVVVSVWQRQRKGTPLFGGICIWLMRQNRAKWKTGNNRTKLNDKWTLTWNHLVCATCIMYT